MGGWEAVVDLRVEDEQTESTRSSIVCETHSRFSRVVRLSAIFKSISSDLIFAHWKISLKSSHLHATNDAMRCDDDRTCPYLKTRCSDLSVGVERSFNSIICSLRFHNRRESDKNRDTRSALFAVVKNDAVVSSSKIDAGDHCGARSAAKTRAIVERERDRTCRALTFRLGANAALEERWNASRSDAHAFAMRPTQTRFALERGECVQFFVRE